MNNILQEIHNELIRNVDQKTKDTGKRYFKEAIELYGVQITKVSKISEAFFKQNLATKPKEEIFGLCNELWKSKFIEDSFVACNWSYYLHKQYETGDFEYFRDWIHHYVTNWASCDSLCNHSVGEFVMMFPEFLKELKVFAKSDNRWVRRAAAVTLIIPARKGLFLKDIFEIADILMPDKDDLVQKGYGWMLKAASQAYQKEVFDYVVTNKAVMPRTALRYAIEKMPKELKEIAMKK